MLIKALRALALLWAAALVRHADPNVKTPDPALLPAVFAGAAAGVRSSACILRFLDTREQGIPQPAVGSSSLTGRTRAQGHGLRA